MNSALASLTETYTDSENEDNHEDPEHSDPEEKQTKAIVVQPKKKISSKFPRRLVSYNDNEMHASDDEQNPSEEVEEVKEGDNDEDKFAKHVKKYGFDLPPEPRASGAKQDPKLQETIANIYQKIKISDFDLNQYIQAEKKFRNPSIYDKLIQYLEINELGTNFPPEIYDVSIYGAESYYEELAKAQKLEMDKLEKQKKENIRTEVIIKESTKRKSKWDQQAPSSAVQTSSSGKTTVISAFGTLKKPKI